MGAKRATAKTQGGVEQRSRPHPIWTTPKMGSSHPPSSAWTPQPAAWKPGTFFRQVPPDCGLAFVPVQHLDPSHASILNEILQRSTTMPVVEAQERMKVAPNSVYVIPPNRDLAIFDGALQLSLPEQPRGHRMPIDAFLHSLAQDQGEKAIGIILSGTGTDGTLGLRAILGAGGVTLVQEPATAKYDGMPSSAIRAGYATQILPVDKMAAALQAGKRTLSLRDETPSKPAATGGLDRILMLLRSGSGHDFSGYKKKHHWPAHRATHGTAKY
ncbi:MAG: chemotaxis protein CheB [Rhodoferax sp.]|nr:chemotaxis protein CheB [Rhodoferax sp.]